MESRRKHEVAMKYLYDSIPVKTKMKMMAAGAVRLWALPLETLLQMIFGPHK